MLVREELEGLAGTDEPSGDLSDGCNGWWAGYVNNETKGREEELAYIHLAYPQELRQ